MILYATTGKELLQAFKARAKHMRKVLKAKGLATKVEVWYNWDGERYQSQTAFSEDATQQTKYNIPAAESYLQYKSKYLHDSATAELLEAFLLAQWKQPHNLIECTLAMDHLDIDFGDIVEFETSMIHHENVILLLKFGHL